MTEDAEQQARDQIVAQARGLPLADAVFAVEQFNNRRRAPLRVDLFELFAATPQADIQEWQRRVVKLLREAYAVGDAFLSKDAPYDAIKERFLRDNPGFGPKTYADAEQHGIMAAFH